MSDSVLESRVQEAIRKNLMESMAGRMEATPPPAGPNPLENLMPKVFTRGAGQEMASKVLGIKLGKNDADFPVTVMDKPTLPIQVAALVPQPDPAYRIQKDAALRLLRALEDGDKVLITGPTGSGKSSLIKQICALTNRPFIRVNMTGDTESASLFGSMVVRDGATVWEDGPVTEAIRYGAVLLMDEWELMGPEISMGMQWVLEDDGYLYLKEKPGTSEEKLIRPHKDFRLICGGNTTGQGDDTGMHAGTNVQNTATIDRFQTVIVLAYLEPKHEEDVILRKNPELQRPIVEMMVKTAAMIRKAYAQGEIGLTVSPRTLINWGRKIVVWGDVRVAFTIAFLDKLRETDRKVVSELYNKVWGR